MLLTVILLFVLYKISTSGLNVDGFGHSFVLQSKLAKYFVIALSFFINIIVSCCLICDVFIESCVLKCFLINGITNALYNIE